MNTKNKTLALVEIAIVLCSLFLVAIPAIAAEQNQEMQKASASEVTAASEDDYVLDIYGNANEDDTIDMRDLTYVKLIFFGKKPETELADAKYDGKINPLDFIQIKLIIVGKEKELTIIDTADRIVTVKKPIKRLVMLSYADVIRIFSAQDKTVGVSSSVAEDELYYPELSKLPSVGGGFNPDYEAMLSLNPDLVIMSQYKIAKHAEKLPGIPVVGVILYKPEIVMEELERLAYLLDRREEVDEFIDFYEEYVNTIKERTEGISEDDRPRVYFESPKKYKTGGGGTGWDQKIVMAGGNNIFSDLPAKSYLQVDPEEVVERNPEIIVKEVSGGSGYATDDATELTDVRDEIMSRPELANVIAVKEKKVYIIHIDIFGGFNHLPGAAYFAKWFQPELFKDLDPKAIHQEYLTEFQGLDYDLDEHGVFVYPPLKD